MKITNDKNVITKFEQRIVRYLHRYHSIQEWGTAGWRAKFIHGSNKSFIHIMMNDRIQCAAIIRRINKCLTRGDKRVLDSMAISVINYYSLNVDKAY